MDLDNVLRFLDDHQSRGNAAALVTVCAVEGSSMRSPGTIMGVAADGSFAGSLSGGCIENAVVAEALDVLKSDEPRIVRYGAGSPYLDIKLPCGGGLDLYFAPINGNDLAARCLGSIQARSAFSIAVGPDGAQHLPEWRRPIFDPQTGMGVFGHWPAPKLQIIGHGEGVIALAKLAQVMGCGTRVLTPDKRIIAALNGHAISAECLDRVDQTNALESDQWTATIFLFHDHDWEIELMLRAIAQPHFYFGAMGGRQAHQQRCEAILARGITADQIATIRAPIGLFHSSRDPQTLALSTLAEVIRAYEATDFGAAHG